jgi:hydroxymethylpyrimidine/phosphomethylpyrimidine kinase
LTKCALTIAASDSSGGAGIQADLAVFREIGVYGLSVITNVTAQNSLGVHKVCKVAPNIIAAQIDDITRDFTVSACKIGMLYSPQAVELVAERIHRREIPNVVLDPVMNAKHGEVLLTIPAMKRMKCWLIPKVTLITPNAAEAEILTKIAVTNVETAKEAALALVEMGAKYALVKGGHIKGDPVDVLYDGQNFTEFPGKRIDKNMHGAGCALSSAIAARLAMGDNITEAISFAKDYVSKAIENSIKLGKGNLDYFVNAEL